MVEGKKCVKLLAFSPKPYTKDTHLQHSFRDSLYTKVEHYA